MPLHPHQTDAIRKRMNAVEPEFRNAFWGLAKQVLVAIDERLIEDLRAMFALGDADRVVLRHRVLWLLAEKLKGSEQIPQTWTYDGTRGALCPRPATDVNLLDALLQGYVGQVVSGTIKPNVESWIEQATEAMMREVQVGRENFSTVRRYVAGRFEVAMVGVLSSRGALNQHPAEVRKQVLGG